MCCLVLAKTCLLTCTYYQLYSAQQTSSPLQANPPFSPHPKSTAVTVPMCTPSSKVQLGYFAFHRPDLLIQRLSQRNREPNSNPSLKLRKTADKKLPQNPSPEESDSRLTRWPLTSEIDRPGKGQLALQRRPNQS